MLEGFHKPFVKDSLKKSGKGGGLVTYVHSRVSDFEDIVSFCPLPENNPDDEPKSAGTQKKASDKNPGIPPDEFQFLKLQKCKGYGSTKIIVNTYRSPSGSTAKFSDYFSTTVLPSLQKYSSKHIIVTGDFNCDLIKYEDDSFSQQVIDSASQHGFLQIVSRPTRITDHSATLIDHVYTNNLQNTISCNILTLDISDHLAISTTIALDSGKGSKILLQKIRASSTNPEKRQFNDENDLKFSSLIANETFEKVKTISDPNERFNKFSEIYNQHYNTAYPLEKGRPKRKNERKNSKPWILPWLENAISRKHELYNTYIKRPTGLNKTEYKKLVKFCDKHVKLAKAKYYNKYFKENAANSKKQWEMINNLLNRKGKHNGRIKLKDDKGSTIDDPKKVSENFNKYFTSIASKLKTEIDIKNGANISTDPEGYKKTLPKESVNSMYVSNVNSFEIGSIIDDLKNKATLDTRTTALKIARQHDTFTNMLADLINISFEQGICPAALKIARVIPIHKGGPKTDVSNYRPISLLSIFSKIYEKCMYKRVINFLNKNNKLFEGQYGFRAKRSCEHAILNAQHEILSSLNKKQISLLLLIDFSKAFDMVEHSILLKKLINVGIRGNAYKWFESYLSGRKQFVSSNNCESDSLALTYGVPQGSILGPLLFIIYINDLPNVSNLARFILYADDANILITGVTTDEVIAKTNKVIQVLCDWVDCNRLLLNLKKTHYMIFSRSRRVIPDFNLKIDNVAIKRETETKFLGVIIDDGLTWKKHIVTMKTKMSRYLGVMYRLRTQIPLKARLLIFHSFIQSHLNYCSLVWGFAAESTINSLFCRQKAGIRAVMSGQVNYKYKSEDGTLPTHTKSSFQEHNILTIHGIIVKNTLLFMHQVKFFPKSLPPSVVELINISAPCFSEHPDYESNQEWAEVYNSIPFRSSLFFKGPLLSVSEHNKCILDRTYDISKLHCYKNAIKPYIMENQSLGEPEQWPTFILNKIQGLRRSRR